jgi:hypothetical protein
VNVPQGPSVADSDDGSFAFDFVISTAFIPDLQPHREYLGSQCGLIDRQLRLNSAA